MQFFNYVTKRYFEVILIILLLSISWFGCMPPNSSSGGGGNEGNSGYTWTWISGSDTGNQSGVYGTKGVPASTNMPSSRDGSISWLDSSNNLWLFGGDGYDSAGDTGRLNDLWRYDGSNWTWISGSNTRNQSGDYGTMLLPAPTNMPGARSTSTSWLDNAHRFCLFGGYGYDSAGIRGYLNDLWRYDGSNWTWISGSNIRDQSGVYGTVPASGNIPGGRRESISWIDSSNNLWLFGGLGYDSAGSLGRLNDLWRYSVGTWTWISGSNTIDQSGVYGTKGVPASGNTPGGRSESISWIDSSNNLWLFGGDGFDSAGDRGRLNDLWRYDGTNWTWISGNNIRTEIGVYGTKGVTASSNIPGARRKSISWIDSSSNLWLFGGYGYDSAGSYGRLNDLWRFDGTNWTWISGSNLRHEIGVYGTKGVAASSNIPGARMDSISWIDTSGNLWLFGGDGYDAGSLSSLNDLWIFNHK